MLKYILTALGAASLAAFSFAQTGPSGLDQTDEINADTNIEKAEKELLEGRIETGVVNTGGAKNIVGGIVTLRALDKVTAQTRDFDVAIGESLSYGTLTVKTFHCEIKPPEQNPETFAFLQIFEPERLTKEQKAKGFEPLDVKRFSGWMLASEPAISALDHPVYDIWVIGCKGGDIPA